MDNDARTRILDATEGMCERLVPSDISMRAIAQEADVSVGLAYHYFDSKNELFGRVLDRMAVAIAAGAESGGRPAATLVELWSRLGEHPAFVRLIASLVLSGKDVSAVMSGHPLIVQVAAEAAERGEEDPPVAAATLALFVLAGGFFGPPLNNTIGRDSDDPRLFDALVRLLDQPGGGSDG